MPAPVEIVSVRTCPATTASDESMPNSIVTISIPRADAIASLIASLTLSKLPCGSSRTACSTSIASPINDRTSPMVRSMNGSSVSPTDERMPPDESSSPSNKPMAIWIRLRMSLMPKHPSLKSSRLLVTSSAPVVTL